MRSYSQISPTFWVRGSGKQLRGNKVAQLLALYFMTCPASNEIGLYYLSFDTIVAETGLTTEEIEKALEDIKTIVSYDRTAELVWIPESASYQLGKQFNKRDKRQAIVKEQLELIDKNHSFVFYFYAKYSKAYELESGSGQTSFLSNSQTSGIVGESTGQTSGNPYKTSYVDPVGTLNPSLARDIDFNFKVPEKERENTGDHNKIDLTHTRDRAREKPDRIIFEFWQKKMGHKNAKFDSKRKTRINARLKDGFTPKELCQAIVGATKDDWLMGRDKQSNRKYDDIEHIFRDVAQVERLIELSGNKSGISKHRSEEEAEQLRKKHEEAIERDREMQRKKLHGDNLPAVSGEIDLKLALKGIG